MYNTTSICTRPILSVFPSLQTEPVHHGASDVCLGFWVNLPGGWQGALWVVTEGLGRASPWLTVELEPGQQDWVFFLVAVSLDGDTDRVRNSWNQGLPQPLSYNAESFD